MPKNPFAELLALPHPEIKTKDISGEDALDILEIAAQADQPEQVAIELKEQIEFRGESVLPLRNLVEEQESAVLGTVLQEQLQEQLVDPELSVPAKVAAAEFVEKNTTTGNLLFSDILAGQHVRQMIDDNKRLQKLHTLEWIDRETIELVPDYPQLTKQERKQFQRGFMDRYLTAIFAIPHWLHIGGNQDDLDAWTALQLEQSKRSEQYRKGNGWTGTIFGAIFDPFGGPIFASGLATLKTSWSLIKASMAVKRLSNTFGPSRVMEMLSKSGESLKEFFRVEEKMMVKILEETRGKTDAASQKLFNAAEEAAVPTTQEVKLARTHRSPMATVATNATLVGDDMAQEAVKEGVLLANYTLAATTKTIPYLLTKAIDAGDALPLTLIPDIPKSGVVSPLTKHGTDVNNAAEIANTVADSILYDVVSTRQCKVLTVDVVRISPLAKDSLERAAEFGVSGEIFSDVSKMRSLLIGAYKFKGPALAALVKNVTKNKHTQNAMRKGLSKQLDIIYRDMNKKETITLTNMLRAADDVEDWGDALQDGFKIGEHTFRDATPKIIDAYRARQLMMKNTHRYLNQSAVQQAKANGWKAYGLDFIAAPVTVKDILKGTDILDETGKVLDDLADRKIYEISAASDAEKVEYRAFLKDDLATQLKELPDNMPIIGDRAGYMRVEYTDKYRVFKMIRDKSGRVLDATPVATSDNMIDATAFIDRQMAKSGSESLSYLGIRASDGTTGLIYNRSWVNVFRKMDDTQIDELLTHLKKSGELDDQAIADLLALREKYGYKRASALMTRDKKRLSSVKGGAAPVLTGKEADTAYMAWVSKYLSEAEYDQKLEKSFVKAYGHLSRDLITDPYAPITMKTVLGREANAYQDQLRSITGRIRSHKLEMADSIAVSMADKFIRSPNKTISKISEGFARVLPLPSKAVSGASSIVTTAALGSFNMMQLGLQFSAALFNVTSTTAGRLVFHGNRKATVKAIAQTTADFSGYLSLKVPFLNQVGVGKTAISKSVRDTWEFVEHSGVAAGIDFDAMGSMLKDVRGMRGWAGCIPKHLRKLADYSAYPFKEGERLGQVFSLLATRRLIQAEGKLAVGSKEFMEAVVDRSKVLALNMMKHNSAGITQNELSGIFVKFKDFGLHQGALFAPKGRQGLSKGELVGLYATWLGLFGPKGIPFAWDALIASEMYAGKDDPDGGVGRYTLELAQEMSVKLAKTAKGFGLSWEADRIQQYLEGGIPTVLSDGDVQIASRFAIADFFSDYLTSARMDEAMLGAVYTKHKRFLFEDVPESFNDFMAMIQTDRFSLETTGKALQPLVNQFTGISNLIKSGQLVRDPEGVLRDRQGRMLIKQPKLSEKIQVAIGVTPGKLVKLYDLQAIQMRQRKAITKYTREQSRRIAKLAETDKKFAEFHLDILMAELNDEGYVKLYPAVASYVQGERAMLDKTMGLEQRLLIRAMHDVQATGHQNAVYKELHKR